MKLQADGECLSCEGEVCVFYSIQVLSILIIPIIQIKNFQTFRTLLK